MKSSTVIFDKRIKDFCLVGDGAHASIRREDQGILYLTSKNFKSTGLDLSKVDFISSSDYEKFFNKGRSALVKPEPGDVVFGIIGSIGTPYIVKQNDKFGISSSVAILRPGSELDSNYLYYYMTSRPFQLAVEAIKSGVAQGFLSLEMIRNLPLIKFDLPIQKKIAAILSAYDDLIEINKQRIALLEKMAEEIYREWFVRFRFPGWQNTEFEKGIPKGWETEKIQKAFKYLGGGTPSKDNANYWKEGNINWFTPSDITGSNSIFLSESGMKCNQEGLANSSAKIFPAYSIMMTSRATIGAIGINTMPACTNQGFISCIPNEQYPITYLYHWLKLSKSHFELISSGATFPELSKGVFQKLKILKPNQYVLDEFNKITIPIFKQIESLSISNNNLEKTKNALLPRLISGKLSVENLDIEFLPSMQ
ncbi:MAG: restriction endonuclease subunit S [Merismopediaceae bacterium]|nr:restriction endonuclease subunit S [Merismopediaceae bacterium]